MSAIDFILNLAGLLLWVNWRSMRLSRLVKAAPVSLAGTVRPAAAPRFKGWEYLVVLAALLLLRAWLYQQVGAAADWIPKLDVGLIVLPFRSDQGLPVLLFSVLSFIRVWILFHFWLGALALFNRRLGETDPVQKLIRLHLGRIAHWHWLVQTSLILLLVGLIWAGVNPLLWHLEITSRVRTPALLAEQCAFVAVALLFSLKFLVPAVLLVYFLTSYVYLGSNPLWEFIGAAARTVLAPLGGLPLRVGKLDLAPLVGVILVLLLLHVAPRLFLQRMAQMHLAVWPQ
jgi:uncharacterized protein YggT (Ycf19 family)